MTKEIINKMLDNALLLTALLITVLGLSFILLGAGGGWSKINITITDPIWRQGIGIVGTAVLLFGGIMLAKIFFSKKGTLKSKEYYGISIEHPTNKDVVTSPVEIRGKYKNKPKEPQEMYIFTQSVGSNKYWYPTATKVIYDEVNKSWKVSVHIAGQPEKDLVLAIVGEGSKALCDYSKVVRQETGKNVGMAEGKFPPDWVEWNRVRIHYKGERNN